MYTNTKLRFFFIPFLIIGFIPFYNVFSVDGGQLRFSLYLGEVKNIFGALIAILSIFLYLKISRNNTDPKWVTVIGTTSMYLFCSYFFYKIGILFYPGLIFLGILLGIKFYELDFKESFAVGVIFIMANLAGLACATFLIAI